MARRCLAALLALTLAGCMPPPGPGAGPGAQRSITGSEVRREQLRLQRLAEGRRADYERRVERVARRLLEHVPGQPKIQFLIAMGDPQINAGATFGQVAVTSGILDFLENDDELAVVLGHEIAHITEGHVTKGMLGGLALSILAIVVESQAPGLGNTAGGIGQLFLNRYTQSQERAADRVGLEYVYRSGYDPRAAAAVQERLAVAAPQTMTAGYFDTHPSSVERMISAREQAAELLAQGPPPGRQEVLALQRRGEAAAIPDEPPPPARRAYRRPDIVEEPPPPSRSEDCRRADTYLRRAEDAMDRAESESLYRRAIRYCPGMAAAHAGLAVVLREQGRRDEAERAARRALELDPRNRTARDVLER